MARYKWVPDPSIPNVYGAHHGIGMYFGNSGNFCSNGQSVAHNTRIEAWWPSGPQGPSGSTGYSYNNTCGISLNDDIAYKIYLDGSTNTNNSLQTVRYKVNKWVNYGSDQNPNWVDVPHTTPYVTKTGPLQNFDENARGVFIVATLPDPLPSPTNHHDWTVEIESLNTWWTN